MLRTLLYTKDGQPFIIAGSGTLGWDAVASNLMEAGDRALVLNSGYFGDAFADCLEVYGAKVDQLKAPVGDRPTPEQLEEALKKQTYKIVTITHVDTSTGVISDAKAISETVKKLSPDTLVILDAVCSVASEEIRFDDWGIDVVISASQKGISCPPGLSVQMVSQKALKVLQNRKTPVTSYYASWKRWLPIMEAYNKGLALYFATPPVQLVTALRESLLEITEGKVSLEGRFQAHKDASAKVRKAVKELNLQIVPLNASAAANGMTAVYAPDGIKAADIVPKLAARGDTSKNVFIAAGLHKDIKERYFRLGHMGPSVVSRPSDVDKIIDALRDAMKQVNSN